jgi:hypothetical protein
MTRQNSYKQRKKGEKKNKKRHSLSFSAGSVLEIGYYKPQEHQKNTRRIVYACRYAVRIRIYSYLHITYYKHSSNGRNGQFSEWCREIKKCDASKAITNGGNQKKV